MPQRRNRIYLVVDLTGQRAGEVLFEQESLRGDSAPGTKAREGTPADTQRGIRGSAGFLKGQGAKARGIGYEEERSPTLRSQVGGNSVPCVIHQTPWDYRNKRVFDARGLYPTFPASSNGGQNAQAVVFNTTPISSPVYGSNPLPSNPSHPLCANAHVPLLIQSCVCNERGHGYWRPGFGCLRTEGENRPSRPGHLVCFAQDQRDDLEARNLGECSGALAAKAGMKEQFYLGYVVQGNGIDRADTAMCNGCGWKADVSYTPNTIDRHAVCYQDTVGADKLTVHLLCTDARGNGDGKTCSTVTGDHESRITDYTNVIAYGGDKAGTLDASYYKGAGTRHGKEREFIAEKKPNRKYVVRRLSTTECARLQGFPDCWGIPAHKDSFSDEEAVFWEDVRKTF